MNKTLLWRDIIISITATILLTALFAATFAYAARDSSKHATISNSQSTPSSNDISATDAAPANFLTYENATWGIKIQYPSSWVKQTSGLGVTFVVLANGTNYNNNNIQQPFLAKLNVTSIPGIRTNASLKEMADNVVEGYRFTLMNFQIQSYANTMLSGNNAIKISYSYTDPKNNGFKATDIATIKNNRLYVIQYYYVQSPRQQTYLQTLQKMVDSFQIIG